MKLQDLKNAMQALFRILTCPQCGQTYKPSNVHLLKSPKTGPDGQTILVHSECNKCKQTVMTSVLVDAGDIIGASIKTDLTALDAAKVINRAPISTDDIIKIHQGLGTLGDELKTAHSRKRVRKTRTSQASTSV
jgi:hypothetical protein